MDMVEVVFQVCVGGWQSHHVEFLAHSRSHGSHKIHSKMETSSMVSFAHVQYLHPNNILMSKRVRQQIQIKLRIDTDHR